MQKNANETAKETKNMFLQSAKELKAVTTLAACAMFAALAMILNQVASIDIGPYVRIGFSGIPNRLVDYLFGPVTGCLFSGILDVVKYFLKPSGPFFFGFTFNAMLASFMYGCFYYRKKLTIKRVLAAKFIVMLTVNVLLNTLWISMLYGKGIMVLLPARALKNLIMWPIDSIIWRRNPYCQVQLSRWICLPRSTPTPFNGDFRRPAVVSLLRLHVAPCGSDGILTVSAIAIAVRLRLRTRLTPG